MREGVSEAQKPEGGNIKNDVSVPIAKIPEFIARANAAVLRVCPGARPLPLGHFGDGNVHYNIAQPIGMPKAEFMALWSDLVGAVHETVLHFGGSISAEHGIGQMKRAELAKAKGDVAMDLMRSIKAALDPKGISIRGRCCNVSAPAENAILAMAHDRPRELRDLPVPSAQADRGLWDSLDAEPQPAVAGLASARSIAADALDAGAAVGAPGKLGAITGKP